MKKILVPFDFSEPSVNAFGFAQALARKSGGSVHLLHVIELPVLKGPIAVPVVDYESGLAHELEENALKVMKEVIQKSGTDTNGVTTEIRFGDFVRTVLQFIAVTNADLVVMGSHGASGMREYLVGSNTEKIIRRSTVPVIVIKDKCEPVIRDIVLPLPLSSGYFNELAKQYRKLQNFFNARLHLLWVNTPANFYPDSVAEAKMQEVATKMGLENIKRHIYNDLNEEDGIVNFARSIGAPMIAMSTHGRKGVGHLLTGSLTEDIVNHSPLIVWTFCAANQATEKKGATDASILV